MSDSSPSGRRRHGLFTPFAWAGRSIVRPLAIPEIRAEAGAIRDLYGVLRSREASQEPALVLDADGRFDLEASTQALRLHADEALHQGRITAEHYTQIGDLKATELAALLQRRRIETARAARLNLTLAALFLVAWVWKLCSSPIGSSGLLYMIAGLGLCLVFLGRALLEAHINWQIRTGRMGSLREFVTSDDSWIPS